MGRHGGYEQASEGAGVLLHCTVQCILYSADSNEPQMQDKHHSNAHLPPKGVKLSLPTAARRH